jgi:hypothetical protein
MQDCKKKSKKQNVPMHGNLTHQSTQLTTVACYHRALAIEENSPILGIPRVPAVLKELRRGLHFAAQNSTESAAHQNNGKECAK